MTADGWMTREEKGQMGHLQIIAIKFCGFLFEDHVAGNSVFSHGAHVFIASLAALFYLVSFGCTGWLTDVNLVFPVLLVVVAAVWIPCCISDIIIPVGVIKDHAGHSHGRHRPVSSSSV